MFKDRCTISMARKIKRMPEREGSPDLNNGKSRTTMKARGGKAQTRLSGRGHVFSKTGDAALPGKEKLRLFLLSIIALVGLACSQQPSESNARQLLESYLKRQVAPSEVQVVSLHKTDGLAETENGAKYYTMDYQADVVFPKGHSEMTTYKAGEGYKEDGRLRFVRTENGWRLLERQVFAHRNLGKDR